MTKVNKEVKSVDLADVDLARELSATFDINAERVWWNKARAKVEAQMISVRGLKETIKLVEQTGGAPTLRSTWSQYFMDAFAVEDLDGGKNQTLKSILNVTIQGTRKLGGRGAFVEMVASHKSFSSLSKAVEKLPKKESAKSSSEGADVLAGLTADEIIERTLISLGELDDPFIGNVVMAESLIKGLRALVASAKSPNHPANRAKASA